MAMPLLFLSFLLSGQPLALAGSKAVQEWQLEDASDTLSLIQLPARKLAQTPDDPLLKPSNLQEQREPFRRTMGLAPEGTQILDRYKACPLHAYPFNDKAAAFVHEASRTHFVHIFKNAGSVFFNSINRTGAKLVEGYAQEGLMRDVLNSTDKDKWFTAALVRDPLRRSLDGFHEVFKRIQCSPPIGLCGEGAHQGFQDPPVCDPCNESTPAQASQWIKTFKEVLPNIAAKVKAGEGLYGHMFPQLSYLTYYDGSKVDLNYLGLMDDKHLDREYDFIFSTQDSLENVSVSAGLSPAGRNLFRINASELTDELVVQVCQTYYVDYCCFGFDFPDACKKAGLTCTYHVPRATSLAQKSKAEAVPLMVPGWHSNMSGMGWHHNMTGMPAAPQHMQQIVRKPPNSTALLYAPLWMQLALCFLLGFFAFFVALIVQFLFMVLTLPLMSLAQTLLCCYKGDRTSGGKTGDLQEPMDIPIPSRKFVTDESQKKPSSQRWNMPMLVCSWSCIFRMMLLWSALGIRMEWHRREVVQIFLVESLLTSFVLWTWARWEDVGHYLTLWCALGAVMCLPILDILFQDELLFMLNALLLFSAQALYLVTHFTSNIPIRLPPFEVKQFDTVQSDSGWLGDKICSYVRTDRYRSAITFMFMMSDTLTSSPLLLLVAASLPCFQVPANHELFVILGFLLASMNIVTLPMIIAKCVMFKSLFGLLLKKDEASSIYNTGDYEVAEIDSDAQAMSNLRAKTSQSMWPSITVILPCYMPIEESIIMDVLGWYRKQGDEYPGELLVLVVWNSPQEHPCISEKLSALCKEWPGLSVHRHEMSTSKADNLNLAISLLTTDVVLVNDADTIVSAACMCRAAMHIHMGNFDVAQCCNTHCLNDYQGTPDGKDRGCFLYQPVIAWLDSFPEGNFLKSYYDRCPFNGRGGFWRVDALKAVGFDHRCLSEDHDAFHRGAAVFGFRGTLDINMLCQERLPPTCSAFINQRVRWRTGAYQTRRNLPMVFKSPNFGLFEKCIEASGMSEKFLFMETIPFRMLALLVFLSLRTYVFQRVFIGGLPMSGDGLRFSLQFHVPIVGHIQVAIPHGDHCFLFIIGNCIMGLLGILIQVANEVLVLMCTRYTPVLGGILLKTVRVILIDPVMSYVEGKAFHQYLWGGAQFIPTIRKTNQKWSNPEATCKAEQR